MNKIVQILELKVRGKAYKGKNMLNVEEFKKKKKRLLEKKNRTHLLSNIELYIPDIGLVCINERSLDLQKLLEFILDQEGNVLNNSIKFKLYWLLFLQSYMHAQQKSQTERIVKELTDIATQTRNVEHKSIVFLARSLLWRIKGEEKETVKAIEKAMKLIKKYGSEFPKTYYQVLYTYTFFKYRIDQNYEEAIKKMKLCFSYYLGTSNALGMIKSYSMLLHFFALCKQEVEFDKLLNYVFEEKRIHENILDSHYIMLNASTGTYCAIINKIDKAINYLNNSYIRIKTKELQNENFYEFTRVIRILCRCYGVQGDFEKAYDLIVELVDFLEQEYVKNNILEEKRNLNYLKSYFTLLFIFVQLDMDMELLKDDKLKVIYEYMKILLSKTPISRYFLVESSLEDENIEETLRFELEKSKNEFHLLLYQALLTQDPQNITEKAKETLETIRDSTYDPIYTDLLLAKIYLARGNFKEFKELTKKINRNTNSLKPLIIQIWGRLFTLLSKYIDDQRDQETILRLIDLQEKCKENNYKKMEHEIELYIRLISSRKAIDDHKNRFRQTAFYDIFSEESKKVIVDYLN
ncbi:MAG: hypothetical protein ACTSSG_14480 [Candidatus Heimdallarchaeaceae archaeon]